MPQPEDAQHKPAVTDADVHAILGDLDDETVAEILALDPTLTDLEAVAMWLVGQGDVPDRTGHPLAGKAAEIFDMLSAQEGEAERPR